MADNSKIEWCDATWNPVRGCTKVSPGCRSCYAETFAERFRGVRGHPYEQGFDLRLVPEKLTEPLTWKKPRMVFVNSMSDLFQDGVPDTFIDRVFAVMALTPQHTYQLLTKRPERMRAYFDIGGRNGSFRAGNIQLAADKLAGNPGTAHRSFDKVGWPMRNVWLGVSVENQHFADERIPLLLQTPAAVRFISAEPLLGPVDLTNLDPDGTYAAIQAHGFSAIWKNNAIGRPWLDWVIVGGESGAGARKFDVRWAREIVAQCAAAHVPVFVKQLGAVAFDSALGRATADYATHAVGATDGLAYLRLRQSKGGDMSEWPEDLRIRQFPETRA